MGTAAVLVDADAERDEGDEVLVLGLTDDDEELIAVVLLAADDEAVEVDTLDDTAATVVVASVDTVVVDIEVVVVDGDVVVVVVVVDVVVDGEVDAATVVVDVELLGDEVGEGIDDVDGNNVVVDDESPEDTVDTVDDDCPFTIIRETSCSTTRRVSIVATVAIADSKRGNSRANCDTKPSFVSDFSRRHLGCSRRHLVNSRLLDE